jgi:hypothetical protein
MNSEGRWEERIKKHRSTEYKGVKRQQKQKKQTETGRSISEIGLADESIFEDFMK